jgi:tetratricopeptide (TPR) repeat protein
MSARAEYERTAALNGMPVRLFVSCGHSDDYLELVLADGAGSDSHVLDSLVEGPTATGHHDLDVRLAAGEPPTVSVLAMYTSDEVARSQPPEARVEGILRALARKQPGLDFGGLLPKPAVPAQTAPTTPSDVSVSVPVAPRDATEETAEVTASATCNVDQCQTQAPPERLPVTLFDRAGNLAARGEVHRALYLVDETLRRDPHDKDAWALREELMLLEARERRRQRVPDEAQAQLEVGFSYLTLGCDALATAALAEAARLKPNLYLAQVMLGVAHHHQKQAKLAKVCYERASRVRPRERTPRELLHALACGLPPPRPVEQRPPVLAKLRELGVGWEATTVPGLAVAPAPAEFARQAVA